MIELECPCAESRLGDDADPRRCWFVNRGTAVLIDNDGAWVTRGRVVESARFEVEDPV